MLNRPSKAVMARVSVGIVALLAALMLPLLSHDVGHAQSAPIEYPEGGTTPVATFSAIDPETGSSIAWSLVTAAVDSANVSAEDVADHDEFTISANGVLEFKNTPNYEDAKDANTNNEYKLTVQARGSGSGDTAYYEVVVNVTNVEELGTVALDTLQPQVRVSLTADVTDPDSPRDADGTGGVTGKAWQWYNSDDGSTWTAIDKATQASYRPAPSDAGKYLRAVVTYNDDKANPDDDPATMDVDESKDTAMAVSSMVLASTTVNTSPDFKDDEGESRDPYDDEDDTTWVAISLKESATGGDDVGNPVTAVDDDVLTYTMADISEDAEDADPSHAALFTIDRASGQISVKAGTKFDVTTDDTWSDGDPDAGPYNVMVTATDPTGATDSVRVIITITDVNEKPTINAADDAAPSGLATIKRDEGGTTDLTGAVYTAIDPDMVRNLTDTADEIDRLEWSTAGPDGSKFNLNVENVAAPRVATLVFKNVPDFEAKADADGNNDYEVTVVVTDSAGNKATRDVTITIDNVEESGSVKISNLRPQVGTVLVAEVSDPDGDVSGVTWQWWRTTTGSATNLLADVPNIVNFDDLDNRRGDGNPNENLNSPDWVKVPGGTSSSYRPVADDTYQFLLAIATYADGKANTEDDSETAGTDETERDRASLVVGDTNPAVETDTLVVRATQTSNSAPKFPDTDPVTDGDQNDPRERRVKENTSGFVGTAVLATDPDTTEAGAPNPRTDTVTHSIGGPDGDLFTINQRTGQISVGSGTKLDFEAEKNTYQVTVTATDPSGASTDTTVNIIVTNVNEKPTITITPGGGTPPSEGVVGGLDSVSVVESTSTVGTYTTEIASPSWNLSGTDAGDFDISSSGVLTFSSPPDYENPADANRDNVYMVTVVASNGGATSATLAVTVTVTNDPSDDAGSAFDPLTYDANGNGQIDRPEVITAIRAYFADRLSRDDVSAVIAAYFASN